MRVSTLYNSLAGQPPIVQGTQTSNPLFVRPATWTRLHTKRPPLAHARLPTPMTTWKNTLAFTRDWVHQRTMIPIKRRRRMFFLVSRTLFEKSPAAETSLTPGITMGGTTAAKPTSSLASIQGSLSRSLCLGPSQQKRQDLGCLSLRCNALLAWCRNMEEHTVSSRRPSTRHI